MKPPGEMAILVAPLVTQFSVLLDPDTLLLGLEANELIAGFPGVFTVTVAVEVVEPAALVAVSV